MELTSVSYPMTKLDGGQIVLSHLMRAISALLRHFYLLFLQWTVNAMVRGLVHRSPAVLHVLLRVYSRSREFLHFVYSICCCHLPSRIIFWTNNKHPRAENPPSSMWRPTPQFSNYVYVHFYL